MHILGHEVFAAGWFEPELAAHGAPPAGLRVTYAVRVISAVTAIDSADGWPLSTPDWGVRAMLARGGRTVKTTGPLAAYGAGLLSVAWRYAQAVYDPGSDAR